MRKSDKKFMITSRKKIPLSLIIKNTKQVLTTYLGLLVFVLSAFYLFGMNNVAMQGYILTQEAQNNRKITMELERLDSKIVQLDTKAFLTEKTEASLMVYNNTKDFFVYKNSYTAKK